MKRQLITCFIVLSVSACTNPTLPREANNIREQPVLTSYNPVERYSELLWVEHANPIADASKASDQGDTRLWAYNTRTGPKIPGIDDGVSAVLQHHQLKMAPAMGDVVHSPKHLELQLKFIDYAKQYNNEIIKNR
jgi:hypothetical protein